VFRTARDLALSYVDPYIDCTGRITGYGVASLLDLGRYDWRLSEKNVWKVEQYLIDFPHRPVRSSDTRVDRLRLKYFAFKRAHPGQKPVDYRGREAWTALPEEWARAVRELPQR